MNTDKLFDLPDWDDDTDEEEGEGWKHSATREACKALYQQWREVLFVLKGLLEPYLDAEEDSMLKDAGGQLLGDAYITGAKIRSSEAGGIYVLRMENAAIIRQLAQGISTELLLFLEDDAADEQHIMVVRDEITKFRMLFIEWINSFEKDEFTDEWGLFV